ncbi:hypothetical protein [Paracoccus sediminilitoris]|uniref:hypothetical protein n=1 Tax=Paracoccus sediminilitoris TaxID=2202419 RepID=UPI001F1CEED0|nr:hypothetical protein [Paracoccus sediminilitoris]
MRLPHPEPGAFDQEEGVIALEGLDLDEFAQQQGADDSEGQDQARPWQPGACGHRRPGSLQRLLVIGKLGGDADQDHHHDDGQQAEPDGAELPEGAAR